VSAFAAKIAEMWKDEFFQYLKQSTLGEPYFEKAISFKQQFLPKRIYKYRSDTPNARKNLISSTIWLASESYNDPYDCFLQFSTPNMASAFERSLIDAFVDGYKLDISLEKINEAKQSPTPQQRCAFEPASCSLLMFPCRSSSQLYKDLGRISVSSTISRNSVRATRF
jgi:hypothetical protein